MRIFDGMLLIGLFFFLFYGHSAAPSGLTILHPSTDTIPISEGPDSLTVYIFLEDECLISQYYTNELTRLYNQYRDDHIGFVGYFPSPMTGKDAISAFADKFKLAFPLYPDHEQVWARKMEITITPEVAVVDHKTDRMIYKGRIDDSYVRVGKRKLHPQQHDLEDIIRTWQLNQLPDSLVQTEAIGCFITFTQ